ncbi:MAG: MFS transporter [Spirochaetes bacterium]|nr:MFS transporter [Spirochaetota bacterium]
MRSEKKSIFSWCLFDFANSAYTTIIITIAYAVIFPQLIAGPDKPGGNTFNYGNTIWGYALALSYLLTALLGPLLGAAGDKKNIRKKILFFSTTLCIAATFLLYFVKPGNILAGIIFIVLSNLGFSLTENFISSFLPDIAPREKIGRISGYAWALGYFGGLASIFIVYAVTGLDYRIENFNTLRYIGPVTALFFLVFSLPTFIYVKEKKNNQSSQQNESIFRAGFTRLIDTYRSISLHKELFKFLFAFFFISAGLTIVITFTAIYGKQVINLQGSSLVLFFVLLQITAALGSFIFGFIEDRIGAKKTINITLVLWIISITSIYFINEISKFFGITPISLFFISGGIAGICLGATQSSARALIAILSPPDKTGEFYGFWGLSGKLASLFSLVIFSSMIYFLGLKQSILLCVVFFAAAFIVMMYVKVEKGSPVKEMET